VVCSHPAVKVVKRPGVSKVRKVHVLLGEGPSDVYCVHNSSLSNVLRGVVERIFTVDYGQGQQEPLPQPREGFRAAVAEAWVYLRSHVPQVSKFTESRFLDHYSDARLRRRYEAAAHSLRMKPLERRDADVQTFVKAEKTNFTAKRDPAPRIISPRNARYNFAVGLYIKAVEGALYKVLDEMCGGKTVMKGLNSQQMGAAVADAWESFHDPVAVAFDAKRFDQHTRTEALRFEHDVYKTYFDGPERSELAMLLSWQLDTKCRAYLEDAIVKFNMNIRASGDMNTGLGTCLIACALTHSYCVRVGLAYRLINNGDDCVVVCERGDAWKLDGFHDFCASAGYFMEVETPVSRIEEIDFCQTHPVKTIHGYVMVRNYPTSIAKDFVTVLPLTTEVRWRQWAADIGACGLALNSGVPVLQAIYAALMRSGGGSFGDHPWMTGSGMVRNAKGLDPVEADVSDEARVSFYAAFGVTPPQQREIERKYATYTFNFRPGLVGYTTTIHDQPVHSISNVLLDH